MEFAQILLCVQQRDVRKSVTGEAYDAECCVAAVVHYKSDFATLTENEEGLICCERSVITSPVSVVRDGKKIEHLSYPRRRGWSEPRCAA